MKLQDIYDQLKHGEMQQMFPDPGELTEEAKKRINALAKGALLDLNKHFSMLESKLRLKTNPTQTNYFLIEQFALTSNPTAGYILDSKEAPFAGPVDEIINVKSESTGQYINLNGVDSRTPGSSIYGDTLPKTLRSNSLLILGPGAVEVVNPHDDVLLIRYKRGMSQVLSVFDAPPNLELGISDRYMNAIVLYIASRIFNPMGAETIGRGMFHEGNNYWSKYLAEIADLKANYSNSATSDLIDNFRIGGWV